MTGSVALDVVIGLVFIYLLYSLLATIVQELVASYLSLRAKNLEQAIKRMLDDDSNTTTFSNEFYSSPLIKYLASDKTKKPAYITAKNFSKVILDILKGDDPKPGEDFRTRIDAALSTGFSGNLKSIASTSDTYKFLQSLWADSQGDIEKFKTLLEQWFDDTMERASGWYKKKTQTISFFIGLCIAIIFNVNSIQIAGKLADDPVLRQQLVQQADRFVKEHPDLDSELQAEQQKVSQRLEGDSTSETETDTTRLQKLKQMKVEQDTLVARANKLIQNDLAKVNGLLGLGYKHFNWSCPNIVNSIFGWLLTALALSLGAPFWFDLLNKLMKLRSSIATSSEPSEKETAAANGKAINPKG